MEFNIRSINKDKKLEDLFDGDLIDIDNDGENSVIIYLSKINETIIDNINKIIEVDASNIKLID